MSEQVPEPEQSWDVGWDGHERAQVRRTARLPLWQKLQWLEDINRLARCLESQRKARRDQARKPSAAPPDEPS